MLLVILSIKYNEYKTHHVALGVFCILEVSYWIKLFLLKCWSELYLECLAPSLALLTHVLWSTLFLTLLHLKGKNPFNSLNSEGLLNTCVFKRLQRYLSVSGRCTFSEGILPLYVLLNNYLKSKYYFMWSYFTLIAAKFQSHAWETCLAFKGLTAGSEELFGISFYL